MAREHNRAIFGEVTDFYKTVMTNYDAKLEEYAQVARRTLREHGLDPERYEELEDPENPNEDVAIYESGQLLFFHFLMKAKIERLPEMRVEDEEKFVRSMNVITYMSAAIAELGIRIMARASELDAARGKRIVDAAKEGHISKWGTSEQKKARWAKMQAEVDRLWRPEMTHNDVATRAAAVLGYPQKKLYSPKSIKRHTKIPSHA
jgi:hypothetical protein